MEHEPYKKFRESAERRRETPPAGAWDRIVQSLDSGQVPPPAPKRGPWLLLSTAIIAVTTAALLWWNFSDTTEEQGIRPVASSGQPVTPAIITPAPATADTEKWVREDAPSSISEPVSAAQPLTAYQNPAYQGVVQFNPALIEAAVTAPVAAPVVSPLQIEPAALLNLDNDTTKYFRASELMNQIALTSNVFVEPDDMVWNLNASRNDMSLSRALNYRTPQQAPKVDYFNWLIGAWKKKGNSPDAMVEEWQAKDDFSLTGRCYFSVNGDTMVMRSMRIEQIGENLYYILAEDTAHQEHRFRLRSYDPSRAVFENETNTGPREIIYDRKGGNEFISTGRGLQTTDPEKEKWEQVVLPDTTQ